MTHIPPQTCIDTIIGSYLTPNDPCSFKGQYHSLYYTNTHVNVRMKSIKSLILLTPSLPSCSLNIPAIRRHVLGQLRTPLPTKPSRLPPIPPRWEGRRERKSQGLTVDLEELRLVVWTNFCTRNSFGNSVTAQSIIFYWPIRTQIM